jgi:phospholipase/carboxylesterase
MILVFLLISFAREPDLIELRREYVRNGMTAYTQGNYEEAILQFKNALNIDSTDAPVAYNIACCYSLLNEKDSAITWIERTIKLGSYMFASDSDFDNIRESDEFQNLVVRAESLLTEARKREWPSYVFIPSDYDSTEHYPVLVMLHGYGASPRSFIGELADFLTERGFIYIVPYGTEVLGTRSFAWGEFEEVENKIISEIENVIKNYSVDISKVVLAGYSQGGSLTFNITIRNPALFRGAIPISGTFVEERLIDYFHKLDGKKLSFYIMIGNRDREERVNGNKRAKEILEEHSIKTHLEIFPDVGHVFPGEPDEELGKALDFILNE